MFIGCKCSIGANCQSRKIQKQHIQVGSTEESTQPSSKFRHPQIQLACNHLQNYYQVQSFSRANQFFLFSIKINNLGFAFARNHPTLKLLYPTLMQTFAAIRYKIRENILWKFENVVHKRTACSFYFSIIFSLFTLVDYEEYRFHCVLFCIVSMKSLLEHICNL